MKFCNEAILIVTYVAEETHITIITILKPIHYLA